ncbi:MAG: hypothetical protein Q4D40_04065 [Eubacteriales bacterium]|nr:hypothetical protein [Eubacteriales bacterium]
MLDYVNDIKQKITARIPGELVFFAAFIPYTAMFMYQTTMFEIFPARLFKLLKVGCMGLLLLKVFIYGGYSKREAIVTAVMLAAGLLSWRDSTLTIPFMMFLLIAAAKGVDFERIVKAHFTVRLVILLITFAAALTGHIENIYHDIWHPLMNWLGWERSYALGIIHNTDCSAQVFYLMIEYLYLRRRSLRVYDLIGCLTVTLVIFRITACKVDLISSALVLFLFAAEYLRQIITDRFKSSAIGCNDIKKLSITELLYKLLGVFVVPLTAAVSIGLSYRFSWENELLIKLNSMLTGRLSLGRNAFDQWNITPFGQYIRLVGFGGISIGTTVEGYNFIDCSYLNILMTMGAVILGITLIVFVFICCKYSCDHYLILIITALAVSWMADHHLMDIAYNVFMLLLFAKVHHPFATGKQHCSSQILDKT